MPAVIPTLSCSSSTPSLWALFPTVKYTQFVTVCSDLSVSGHPVSIPPSGENALCVRSWWVLCDAPRDAFGQVFLSLSKDRGHVALAQSKELLLPWFFKSQVERHTKDKQLKSFLPDGGVAPAAGVCTHLAPVLRNQGQLSCISFHLGSLQSSNKFLFCLT